jgi:polysaccharide chain length determinant protein (PEP-CTERM system associated)
MELRDYGILFLRRKWEIIFSVLIILFVSSIYCVVTPELYKSSITILIIPQTVPQDYVRSTISLKVEEQLATIKQQVMSRTTLTKVMDELRLFEKERKKLSSEEVFAMLRKRIDIEVVQGRSRDSSDAFTLSFLHEAPQSAMRAAGRLASLFIDENLKTREQQAVGTSEFLDSQLKSTKATLEVMEQRVKDYKMRYMGELPQQMDANLRVLAGLQDRLRSNESGIRTVEERKAFIEAQINLIGISIPNNANGTARPSPAILQDPVQYLVNDLAGKKAKLADLGARYTDKVPEVARLKQDVMELEMRIAEAQRYASRLEAAGANGDQKADSQAGAPPVDEETRRLRAQLKAAAVEISSLKKERDEIRKSITAVEQKIEQSPRREQEMISLIRDYENQKHSYDDLLKKKLEADVSQNLEKRQKGTQFQILDPANLPEAPFKPDRKKVMGISLLLALAIGFGGTLAWESIDLRLRDIRDFRYFFKVPILGYIPLFQDQNYMRAQTMRRAAVYGGLITFTMVFSLFLLAYRDKIRIILNF